MAVKDMSQDNVSVIMTVRDTGIGMTEQQLDVIFEPYYRVAYTSADAGCGIGLGLSIVKQLVESLHGDISVDSTLGKGSQFIVTIPCKKITY